MEIRTTIQNKKSIKQRTAKFINGIKNDIPNITFNFSYVGSITEPKPMKINEEGYYDIDINLNVSTDLGAQETYEIFQKAFKNNLRNHENQKSKRNAVIHIYVSENGFKYNYDFAIFNLKNMPTGESKKMIKQGNTYKWE